VYLHQNLLIYRNSNDGVYNENITNGNTDIPNEGSNVNNGINHFNIKTDEKNDINENKTRNEVEISQNNDNSDINHEDSKKNLEQ